MFAFMNNFLKYVYDNIAKYSLSKVVKQFVVAMLIFTQQTNKKVENRL